MDSRGLLPSEPHRPRRPRERRSRRARSELAGSAVTSVLAVLIVGAPMLLGGAVAWTAPVIAAWALVALAVVVACVQERRLPIPALVIAVCAGAVWTLIQSLPLPCGVVAWLAPASASAARAAQQALGANTGTPYCALSIDPGATRLEVMHGVAISATFAAVWLGASVVGRRRVIELIAASSLAMSGVALLHGAFQLDEVFGLYTPVEVGRQPFLMAPLMNPNNLGAFAALGVPLWLGLVAHESRRSRRVLGYGAVVVSIVVATLSLSRGAIAMVTSGVVAMAWFLYKLRGASRTQGPAGNLSVRVLSAVLAVALGIGLAVYFAAADVRREFETSDLEKIDLVWRAFVFAGDHPWLGVGRGAFSSTFVAVEGTTTRFAYAENFLAQWASEWGAVFTLALCAVIGLSLWREARRSTSLAHTGACVAIVLWAAQNLADLGFELVGIACVGAALLAVTALPLSAADRNEMRVRSGRLSPRRFALGLLGCGALALAWLGPSHASSETSELQALLQEQLTAKDRDGFRATLRRAVRLHPTEPVFAVLASAEAEAAADDQAAERWAERALRLAPGWAATHQLAARAAMRKGDVERSLRELRAAAEVAAHQVELEVCALMRSDPQLALRAAPVGPIRIRYLEMAERCVAWDSPAGRWMNGVLLREAPDSVQGLQRRAYQLARLDNDLEEALRVLDRVLRVAPHDRAGFQIRMELLIGARRYREALETAARARESVPEADIPAILGLRALAQAELGDAGGVEETIRLLRRLSSSDVTALARSYAAEGDANLRMHRPGEAFHAYREAYRIDEDPAYARAIASIATSLGDKRQALWAYMTLCQREPHHADYCAKRDELVKAERVSP